MTNTNTSLISPLPDWTLIQVRGPDSSPFLQNLLTNNILSLAINEQQLSGFCSPKGRLLASFWISHPAIDSYDLWISADIAQEFSKKLSMYRLRSKVMIELKTELNVYGHIIAEPGLDQSPIQCNLPSVFYNHQEYHRRLIATSDVLMNSDSQYLWRLLEVHSGISRITDATKDLFIPQMINFESVGAVDFKKGCYPGQEIVARSQYLGAVKRRLKIAYVNNTKNQDLIISPGMEVYSTADPDQACGVVVLSSMDISQSRYYFQLEIKLSQTQENLYFKMNDLQISDIVLLDPPYPLITI